MVYQQRRQGGVEQPHRGVWRDADNARVLPRSHEAAKVLAVAGQQDPAGSFEVAAAPPFSLVLLGPPPSAPVSNSVSYRASDVIPKAVKLVAGENDMVDQGDAEELPRLVQHLGRADIVV